MYEEFLRFNKFTGYFLVSKLQFLMEPECLFQPADLILLVFQGKFLYYIFSILFHFLASLPQGYQISYVELSSPSFISVLFSLIAFSSCLYLLYSLALAQPFH